MVFAVRLLAPIIFSYLVFGTGAAWCQDFFMGKVLAVDPQKMEIEIDPLTAGRLSEAISADEPIRVRIAEKNNLPMQGKKVFLPRCVVVGERIRLWGKKSRDGENVFFATDIRGCRGGGCSDPTGVRSRLMLGRKHKNRYRNLDNTDWQGGPGAHESSRSDHPGSGHGWAAGNGGGGGD